MRALVVIATVLGMFATEAGVYALANDSIMTPKMLASLPPDDNTPVTLTRGELKLLIAKAIADRMAEGALRKLESQLTPGSNGPQPITPPIPAPSP